MKATDPAQIKVGTVDAALNLEVLEIDLLWRLLENDGAAFNQALVKALEFHKKHWDKKKFKNVSRGFLALGPLALASIAYERGINIEVESDYIPEYIVQREFIP